MSILYDLANEFSIPKQCRLNMTSVTDIKFQDKFFNLPLEQISYKISGLKDLLTQAHLKAHGVLF